MKEFIKFVNENPELKEKLKALPEGTPKEDIIQLAKEYGFNLTDNIFEAPKDNALSDDELEAVAGGGGLACFCIAAGGGGGISDKDGHTFGCACPVYGQGGDGIDEHFKCLCPFAGGGGR